MSGNAIDSQLFFLLILKNFYSTYKVNFARCYRHFAKPVQPYVLYILTARKIHR